MPLYARYRPSERAAPHHVLATRGMGLIPLFTALLLMTAQRSVPGPGLWTAAGLAAGLQLILAGAHGLCFERAIRTRMGTWLALTADRWFPAFLLVLQSLFLFVTTIVLWNTLLEVGFPGGILQHAHVWALILLIPLYRLAREGAAVLKTRRWQLLEVFARYALICVTTTWLTLTLSYFLLSPEYMPPPHDNTWLVVILWVVAMLAVIASIVFFIEHVIHREPPPAADDDGRRR